MPVSGRFWSFGTVRSRALTYEDSVGLGKCMSCCLRFITLERRSSTGAPRPLPYRKLGKCRQCESGQVGAHECFGVLSVEAQQIRAQVGESSATMALSRAHPAAPVLTPEHASREGGTRSPVDRQGWRRHLRVLSWPGFLMSAENFSGICVDACAEGGRVAMAKTGEGWGPIASPGARR